MPVPGIVRAQLLYRFIINTNYDHISGNSMRPLIKSILHPFIYSVQHLKINCYSIDNRKDKKYYCQFAVFWSVQITSYYLL